MPETPIEPALTAEEWANVCVEGECRPDDIWARLRQWHPDIDERTGEDEPDYHAIAAVALYKQPFGFTREDVAMLHRLGPILQAFARQNPGDPLWDDAHAAFYHVGRLAERIAALLPA